MPTMLRSTVVQDEITVEISRGFDYQFNGSTSFEPPTLPEIPQEFNIGLLVGPSGSGKSTLLSRFGKVCPPEWFDGMAVASHFESAGDAQEKLAAAGLNSIPSWLRPHGVLSTGEKFRADIARQLDNNAVVDEFTSVVDRDVAKSCSYAIQRYVRSKGLKNIVIASCHYDIIQWLQPCWTFDLRTSSILPRGSLQQPTIRAGIIPCETKEWTLFSNHHYLTAKINNSARCWIVTWEDKPVGFTSAISFPNGHFKKAWREHRTVILPDFQGLGLGMMVSEALGEMFKSKGCRLFSKTSHPRVGGYRNNSRKWRATSKNNKSRGDYMTTKTKTKEDAHKSAHAERVCFSHEYVGDLSC